MNSSKKIKFIDSLLNYIPVFLSFLIPVWFLPITVEFFEFNKLTLITVTTIVMLVLWSIKIVLTKQVIIAKSKVDVAIMIFALLFIVSTVFSINKTSSLFGSPGRWYPSLFGLLTLVLYYYIAASNITISSVKKSLIGLLVGSTISSLVSLLAYYKVFLGGAPYLTTQAFSLTGSSVTALLLASLAAVLGLGLVAEYKNVFVKSILVLTSLINVYYIFAIKEWTFVGLLVAGLGLLVYFAGIKKIKDNLIHYAIAGSGILLSAIVLFVPMFAAVTNNSSFPRPINLPVVESWMIASSTIREYPLVGTGPSTFYLDFPNYRTLSMNSSQFWTFRFDKPFNEYLNVLATLGILGFAAYIFLNFKVIKLAFETKSTDESSFFAISQTALIMVVASYLVTYSTVISDYMMFALLALVVAHKANNTSTYEADSSVASLTNWNQGNISSKNNVSKKEYLHFIAVTPLLALVALGSFLTYKMFVAEFFMRQALNSAVQNRGNETYDYMVKALRENPQMESYQNTYAQTNLALANTLAGKENLSDGEKQTIQVLVAQAIRSSRTATEVVSPLSVGAWETRASIYRAIMNIAKDADKWAVQAYNTAIRLDPTNPLLRVQLGGVYYAQKDYLAAANQFRTAATLKPDYANAHYNLAQALVQLKDYSNAARVMEVVQKLIPAESEDAKKVAAELDEIKKNVSTVAGASDQKPTVDQITAPTGPSNTPQQPLTKPEQTSEAVKTSSTTPQPTQN